MKNVNLLGGFPVVVKLSGGSHGSGVRKADSLSGLEQQINELRQDSQHMVLRKFIADARHIRCVVIGDKVVDAIEYMPVDGDFRTNAVDEPQVKPFEHDYEIFALAENAVKAGVTEFGGVDILIDTNGVGYVAEVNFPCNFARNQMCTGKDISGMIVDYLISKSATH
jgi:ribosomal protein S6--L-glutamate ligase